MRIPIENPTIRNGRCSNIAQYWGENKDYYLKNFGIAGHNGLDFAYLNPTFLPPGDSSYGRPILAPCDMRITKIVFDGEHSTKGNGIYAATQDCELVFWHNRVNLVEVDQLVKKGAKIAEMGNSGAVWPAPVPGDDTDHSGTHLHFGIRPMINNKILFPENGFDGFVDPLPYLEELNKMVIIGNNKTKEQYIKGQDGILRRIANTESLGDFDEAEAIDKRTVLWLDPAEFSIYEIGKTWLAYDDK